MAGTLNPTACNVVVRPWPALAALFCVVVASQALAQSGADLEKAKGCPACHAADSRKIGPAYAEIAARYRTDAAASERLVAMLKDGRRHPRAAGSDAELRALVAYVLSAR